MKTFYNKRNVLVTGGAGFIGSHIAQQLVQYGAYVTILDNFKTGKIENIAAIKQSIALIEGDIMDYATCLKATTHQELIFHCAAETSVPESLENPSLYFSTNVTGTANILETARINNVKRLIFSSSSAVYGQQTGLCTETAACNPTSPYGFSKLIGELLCKQYTLNFNVETVILRYFNVFGPRQDLFAPYASVIASFKTKMAQNKPITIYGDGLQTRDFVHVQHIVDSNLRTGFIPAQAITGSVLNCATGSSITLLQLIQKLRHEFPDFTEAITFAPARAGDIKHTSADCALYNKIMAQFQEEFKLTPSTAENH